MGLDSRLHHSLQHKDCVGHMHGLLLLASLLAKQAGPRDYMYMHTHAVSRVLQGLKVTSFDEIHNSVFLFKALMKTTCS